MVDRSLSGVLSFLTHQLLGLRLRPIYASKGKCRAKCRFAQAKCTRARKDVGGI